MKVGCAAWVFTKPRYGAPYESAINTIGELGFNGLELIVHSKEDLDQYYSPSKITELRKQYQSFSMELSQFVVYTPLVQGMLSDSPQEVEKAFFDFRKAVSVGYELGASIINLVSHWVDGLTAPHPINYPPNFINPFVGGVDRTEPKIRMTLPDEFDWEKIWKRYMNSISECLMIVEQKGMKLALEGHAHVIVSNVDAMLRMLDWIPSEHLGVTYDTAWHLIQREYAAMAVRKLGRRVFSVHVRDGDGLVNYGLPPGYGVIDWPDLIDAFYQVGYEGFLTLELTRYMRPEKYIFEAKEYLEGLLR